MGRDTRRVMRNRMSQEKLDSLIVKKPVQVEREHIEPTPLLFNNIEYDTMQPELIIKEFCANIRNMLSRYQYNKDQFAKLEEEMQDLLHYIEMGTDKNANIGYKLYKRLAEIRRDRRACKNEMDLLQPIYDAFGGGDKLNILAQIQGACRSTKQIIDGRAYTVRTDVLEPFINAGRD